MLLRMMFLIFFEIRAAYGTPVMMQAPNLTSIPYYFMAGALSDLPT